MSIDCIRIINADNYVTGSQDGSLALWKSGKKKPLKYFKEQHSGKWITSLAVLKSSDLIASGSYDGYIRLYRATNNDIELKSSIKADGYITSLDFSKNGKFLVAAVSPDHKFGRWTETIKKKPGIFVINLDLNFTHFEFKNNLDLFS